MSQSCVQSSLILPVVLWGKTPPKHKISCIRSFLDGKTIITGSFDGEIVIWERSKNTLYPKILLIGHDASVSALSPTSSSSFSTRFVSASNDGQMVLWDSVDGRSIDTITLPYVHRSITPYSVKNGDIRSSRLYCIGDYSDILVIDPNDLNILFSLNSRVDPDWIVAITFANFANSCDMVIGISANRLIKTWKLSDLDKRDNSNPIYEGECRSTDTWNAVSISWNVESPSILLVTGETSWKIYSLYDLELLFSLESRINLRYGVIFDPNRVAIAMSDGSVEIYALKFDLESGFDHGNAQPKNFQSHLCATLQGNYPNNHAWRSYVNFHFAKSPRSSEKIFYRVDIDGDISLWKLADSYSFPSDNGIQSIAPTIESNLPLLWGRLKQSPPSLFDFQGNGKVTASLFISSQGRLIIGLSDGSIVITSACESVSKQLLDCNLSEINCRYLYGHTSSVTCLLFPHEEHSRYDRQVLVSGSSDFSVIIWNINTGSRLYRFCVQGGPILKLLIPPDNCNARILRTICSIAGDNSAALLSLKENKCLLLASRQTFPIIEVKWRPLDDFLVLKCEDDSLYIWQMDTANLERIVTGSMCEEILTACDEQIGVMEGDDEAGASQAVQMLRAFRNKNINAVRQLAIGNQEEKTSTVTDKEVHLSPPMSIQQLTKYPDTAHIIFFNVDSLIVGLHSLESEISSVNLIENKSLSTILKNKSHEVRPPRIIWHTESNLYMDIARLCLSLLHAWNLDSSLDTVCLKKLRLQKPTVPLSFGIVSRLGHISVLFPREAHFPTHSSLSPYDVYSSSFRWNISSSLSTVHLMAVISLANTLMSFRDSSLELNRKRALIRKASSRSSSSDTSENEAQVKQGWSLLAAMHCCLLPEILKSKSAYCPPRIEILARRWQDPCLEIREASKALLIRELNRLASKGRKKLIESWAAFLPTLLDPTLSIFGPRTLTASMNTARSTSALIQPPPIPPRSGHVPLPDATFNLDEKLEVETGLQQIRRNQATAVVLFGVIGGEFPDELNQLEYSRATAQSLLELLVSPASSLLPQHSPLRRAAIDLIGRGFCVWQPHIDISKVLLALLDSAASSDKSEIGGYAILPAAVDTCRTARHALSLIATVRPPALITALSKEVARYNSAAQHQTIQHTVMSPLLKSRLEVLRIIEQLSDKQYTDVVELLLPVGEILVHCLDTSLLKHKTLSEIFPPITKFYMVAYCATSRRIAFGGRNGSIVAHELRAVKSQVLQAHNGAVTSLAFSEDGKYLASYGAEDAKISFWQTSQSFLGMGQSQLRCIRSQAAPSIFPVLSPTGTPQPFKARLVWISSKCVTLMLPNGKEHRFTI